MGERRVTRGLEGITLRDNPWCDAHCRERPCFHDLLAQDKSDLLQRLAWLGYEGGWGDHKAFLIGQLLRLGRMNVPSSALKPSFSSNDSE